MIFGHYLNIIYLGMLCDEPCYILPLSNKLFSDEVISMTVMWGLDRVLKVAITGKVTISITSGKFKIADPTEVISTDSTRSFP